MKRIALVRNEIVNTLKNNKNIKRYLTYLTRSPLEDQGRLLDGTIIDQPEVEEDLVFENPLIYPTPFTEKLLSESKAIIFVHYFSGSLKELDLGKQTYCIDIVIPLDYYSLNESQDRHQQIACELMNELDQELVGGNGIEKYNFASYTENRLSNTNDYAILSLIVEVNALTMKSGW